MIERRLQELSIDLPSPETPVANYVGVKRSGDLLFVSARVSELRGEVGTDVSRDEAHEAARQTLVHILSIIRADLGTLDDIVSVEKMTGFVRSSPAFIEQPAVVDGASDLWIELLGEAGRHARTATGVAQLPFGAAVQLDMVLRLASASQPDHQADPSRP